MDNHQHEWRYTRAGAEADGARAFFQHPHVLGRENVRRRAANRGREKEREKRRERGGGRKAG
eukprot:2356570-Rhodomonas_salina.2